MFRAGFAIPPSVTEPVSPRVTVPAAQDEPNRPERHQLAERRGRRPIGAATDPALVDRARLGDLDAFESIVRARMDAVYRLSLAILGDEADARDASQEAFVAAWRELPKLRDASRFDAWLQRITVNAARMTMRARSRRRVREIHVRSPAGAADGDSGVLAAALDTLPIEQRTLLAMHYLDDRPIAEIADILEIPAGTVKSRLFTARRALDDALRAEGEE
jgi:RNA polymerase sigma-70 factor (ECF subfamily)